jgi:hypothetical protein
MVFRTTNPLEADILTIMFPPSKQILPEQSISQRNGVTSFVLTLWAGTILLN